jgi:muconolactone D-isomerase
MLFAVTMDVDIPLDLDPSVRDDTVALEKAYSQELQRAGKWPHIWRIVGQYSNLSILDVESTDELHDILWNLPLFKYMTIDVKPLAAHPSDINAANLSPGPPNDSASNDESAAEGFRASLATDTCFLS